MFLRKLVLVSFLAGSALPAFAQERSTWQVIQQDIFDRNCTFCHTEGTSFARQSGLVLTQDVAYTNLVGAEPANSAARSDGLLRVFPGGTIAAPHKSFLWEKINAAAQDHFLADHPHYGSLMPLGLPALTNGQIQFLRTWIENRAPEDGVVADEAMLLDTTRYEAPPFAPLDPPAEGIQFHLGPFNVWSSEKNDREFLYYEPFETTEDLFIKRYTISMRPGSHHFILYNYPAGQSTPQPRVFRDMRDAAGVPNISALVELGSLFPFYFFVGTQTPFIDYNLPPGVALRLPAGSGFDLNSHSVNRSGSPAEGEVFVNLHTAPRESFQHVADYDNFSNTNITLPPGQVTTLSRTFTFEEDRHVIQMWSHSHEQTVEFRVEGASGERDGELLYWTNDWEHPPLLQLDPPMVFKRGDKVRLVTTWNNQTNRTIRFGPLSSDEMQFLFYIYYTTKTTDISGETDLPSGFELAQNYPNPFNPQTTISFALPTPESAQIQISTTQGRQVRSLEAGPLPAGRHSITWDGRDDSGRAVSSGVYVYVLRAGDFRSTRKMLLLR